MNARTLPLDPLAQLPECRATDRLIGSALRSKGPVFAITEGPFTFDVEVRDNCGIEIETNLRGSDIVCEDYFSKSLLDLVERKAELAFWERDASDKRNERLWRFE